jgi:hypothetical protein
MAGSVGGFYVTNYLWHTSGFLWSYWYRDRCDEVWTNCLCDANPGIVVPGGGYQTPGHLSVQFRQDLSSLRNVKDFGASGN